MNMKSSSGSDREKMIDSIDFAHYVAPSMKSSAEDDSGQKLSEVTRRGCWSNDAEGHQHVTARVNQIAKSSYTGNFGYYGPCSIYASELLRFMKISIPTPPPSLTFPLTPGYFDLQDPVIQECLANYFYWNEPHSAFINWDSLLTSCVDNKLSREHSSVSLVFAISSLGALMSSKHNTRILAHHFFDITVSLLNHQTLLSPCLTSIQTLICCSIFELGIGNASKAWMYSGR